MRTTMRAPLQSRSESSADRMIAAVIELLEEGGMAAVTVAEVARRAGASNGSLYHRFGDRSRLVLAAQERVLATIAAETAAAFTRADAEPDVDRATVLLSRAALGLFSTHRGAMRAFLTEAVQDPAFAERNDASRAMLGKVVTAWFRTRLGAGEAAAQDAFALIYSIGAAQAVVGASDLDAMSAEALARAVTAVAGGST